MENALQELANLGSEGVLRAVEGYTRWYLVSAICWCLVGIVFVIIGYKIGKHKLDEDSFIDDTDVWNGLVRYIAGGIVILLGLLIAIHNLSTICAPEAYAIHNLISDIKP